MAGTSQYGIAGTYTLISPAQAGTPSTLTANFAMQWDSSVLSVVGFGGYGEYSFVAASNSLGVVSGLTSLGAGFGYTNIEYGFYVIRGLTRIVELGVFKTAQTYSPDATLLVRRVGAVVTYYVDGALVYTSTKPSNGVLNAVVSLYAAGDSVSQTVLTSGSAGYATLAPIQGVGSNTLSARSTTSLQPLRAAAGIGSNVKNSTNYMQPLVARGGTAIDRPTYALSGAALPFFDPVAHGITDEVGNSIVDLQALETISSNKPYGASVRNIEPLVTRAGEGIKIKGYGLLTIAGNYSLDANVVNATPEGVAVDLPALTMRAYTGAVVALSAPHFTLTASGTVPGIARVDAGLPSLQLVANGKVGGTSAAFLQLSSTYTVVARTGAQVVLNTSGEYVVASTGKGGVVGKAVLAIHSSYLLTATATAEAHAEAVMKLPSLTAAPSGKAWLVAPSFSVHAVGGEVVAVTYEAYAINLTSGAVTHYTNYPFDNILRFGAHYYGINATGIYRLGGVLDVATEVVGHIKTFATTLGTQSQKRIPYVYVSGRSDSGVVVGITADEGDTYEYESNWGEVPGTANHRTVPGKNIRGAYYSFEVSNVAGGTLELDEITAHVAQSSRTL